MVSLTRYLGAVLVAITMIAAQIMPAYAGCHSMKHKAASITAAASVATAVVVTAVVAPAHHAGHVAVSDQQLGLSSDSATPANADICLGNCGCACGLSGAFVLAQAVAITSPVGVLLTLAAPPVIQRDGRSPDGPRRPPRLSA
jgi:hypothetical protein